MIHITKNRAIGHYSIFMLWVIILFPALLLRAQENKETIITDKSTTYKNPNATQTTGAK